PRPTLFPYTTLFRSRSAYEIIREQWKVDPKNDANWRRWLHDGVIPDTAFAAKTVRASGPETRDSIPESRPTNRGIELSFRLDPRSEEHTSELQSREN